jgi:hypothetical protein
MFMICTAKADAVCLASCHNHCIGTCHCLAYSNADCDCNVFACNCDCCKQTFCNPSCQCTGSAALSAAPDPNVCVTNCGKCCGNEKATAPDPAQRFKEIDTNSDGKISFEEMVEYLRHDKELSVLLLALTEEELRAKYFTPSDKNGDGVLQPAEFDRDLAPKPAAAATRKP